MSNKFWVGGTGDWSDTDHWASTSGGSSPEVCDSYSESNYSNICSIVYSAYPERGQSFEGNGGTLNSVKFYIEKNGSPTGNCYAKIYAHTGTFGTSSVPTGSVLATSDALDVSTLATSFALTTFTFSGDDKITLTDGTYYCVLLSYSGGDSSNRLFLAEDYSTPTHGGNNLYYKTSETAWKYDADYDVCFYVYTDEDTSGASIPTSSDDVFIDENSGFGSGGTITLDESLSSCNDFTCNSGDSFTIETGQADYDLYVQGDFTLESGVTWGVDKVFFGIVLS